MYLRGSIAGWDDAGHVVAGVSMADRTASSDGSPSTRTVRASMSTSTAVTPATAATSASMADLQCPHEMAGTE